MQIYNPFKVRKALKTFQEFEKILKEYWQLKEQASKSRTNKNSSLQNTIEEKRDKLSRLIPYAEYYEEYLNLNLTIYQYPPPVIGGPVISYSPFAWPLAREIEIISVPKQYIMDRIVFAVEAAKIRYKESIKNVINPFFWIIYIPSQILRIPFLILRQTGVSPKIEENIISQAFKVLSLIGIIYILLKIPFFKDNDTLDLIINLIK
ncbi:MAG: hypothetical protein H8E87_06720 [FCB group bacterium]|nr:hypothetical protein [FCB group bacterium]